MAKKKIECINKTQRTNIHEKISHVGGTSPSRWKLTQEAAISAIKSGSDTFYVERRVGHAVDVVVATSASGNEYLKTKGDDDLTNNLLSLPECP